MHVIYAHTGLAISREYVSAPVVSNDSCNADTEAPSEQDQFISSIEESANNTLFPN